jgi:hypothetical protein
MTEGDYVMAHGRYSAPTALRLLWTTSLSIKDGVFQEHWDVIEDEATKEQSKDGLPMFGDEFAKNVSVVGRNLSASRAWPVQRNLIGGV